MIQYPPIYNKKIIKIKISFILFSYNFTILHVYSVSKLKTVTMTFLRFNYSKHQNKILFHFEGIFLNKIEKCYQINKFLFYILFVMLFYLKNYFNIIHWSNYIICYIFIILLTWIFLFDRIIKIDVFPLWNGNTFIFYFYYIWNLSAKKIRLPNNKFILFELIISFFIFHIKFDYTFICIILFLNINRSFFQLSTNYFSNKIHL